MKLATVYARFYKSFNFDHLRKAHRDAQAKPWEMHDGAWYPYIEVPIDRLITTVVGANESGKSHLLSAIEKAITGDNFHQRDLCRYSPFFTVKRGRTAWPHVGVAWTELDEEDAGAVLEDLGVRRDPDFSHFVMFREGPERLSTLR